MVTAAVEAVLCRCTASAQQSDEGGEGQHAVPSQSAMGATTGFGSHVFKSPESVNACLLLRRPVRAQNEYDNLSESV